MGCCCGHQPLGDRQYQAREAPNPACAGSEAQKIPGGAQSPGLGGWVKPLPAPNTHQEHPEAGSEDALGENFLEETQSLRLLCYWNPASVGLERGLQQINPLCFLSLSLPSSQLPPITCPMGFSIWV